MTELIDVAHVSKRGSSLRVTIPRKISDELGIAPEDILGFYLTDDGTISIEKVS